MDGCLISNEPTPRNGGGAAHEAGAVIEGEGGVKHISGRYAYKRHDQRHGPDFGVADSRRFRQTCRGGERDKCNAASADTDRVEDPPVVPEV